jgi:hypothetical protein
LVQCPVEVTCPFSEDEGEALDFADLMEWLQPRIDKQQDKINTFRIIIIRHWHEGMNMVTLQMLAL